MEIQRFLVDRYRQAFGDSGLQWIDRLESIVGDCADRWSLGEVRHLDADAWNFVGEGGHRQEAILKCFYDWKEYDSQARLLARFNGRATVQLLDRWDENQAMLLERVVPGIPLDTSLSDGEQVRIAADLIREISTVPPPNGTRPLAELCEEFEEGRSCLDSAIIDESKAVMARLVSEIEHPHLIHGDLHHENILRCESRGWLFIDPEGLIGDAYFEAATFLLSKPDARELEGCYTRRINAFCGELELDRQRLVEWSLAHQVLACCWDIGDGQPGWKKYFEGIEILRSLAGLPLTRTRH